MKITNMLPTDWRDLQDKVCRLLNESGYFAESPKTINTVRGAIEVDVYATSELELLKQFICECKFWNTPIPKEKIHAFRTVVNDSGSMLGIIISKNGFQSGAIEAAHCSNVLLKDWHSFVELIKNQWIVNQFHKLKEIAKPLSIYTDPLDVPHDKLTEGEKNKYINITESCLGVYLFFQSLNLKSFLQDSISVGDKSFTALDELFEYCEMVFCNAIIKYQNLFKNNQIEKWKFEALEDMMI